MKNVYNLIGIELLSMNLNPPMVTRLHVLRVWWTRLISTIMSKQICLVFRRS